MTKGGLRWKPKEIFPIASRRKQELKKKGNQAEDIKNVMNSKEMQEIRKRKDMGKDNY